MPRFADPPEGPRPLVWAWARSFLRGVARILIKALGQLGPQERAALVETFAEELDFAVEFPPQSLP